MLISKWDFSKLEQQMQLGLKKSMCTNYKVFQSVLFKVPWEMWFLSRTCVVLVYFLRRNCQKVQQEHQVLLILRTLKKLGHEQISTFASVKSGLKNCLKCSDLLYFVCSYSCNICRTLATLTAV